MHKFPIEYKDKQFYAKKSKKSTPDIIFCSMFFIVFAVHVESFVYSFHLVRN